MDTSTYTYTYIHTPTYTHTYLHTYTHLQTPAQHIHTRIQIRTRQIAITIYSLDLCQLLNDTNII